MFLASTLLYPCVLALLCLGAGLLLDRLCGGWLPAPLLASVGAAALIGLSQLLTFAAPLAPATPFVLAAGAAAGLIWGRARVGELWRLARARPASAALPVLAYALALAPVLAAGRASFSSFMALSDSAVHMLGADYILHHGQSYAHLDLRNSYGQFLRDYYGTSYPSGADTLFGSSGFLLGLPLIWAFQPFTAFMLALATGPALLLARRVGLRGPWAFAAALCCVLGALVYAYELIGSIKEICSLAMLLSAACLVVCHRRWLRRRAGGVPLALVLAAGVSCLGVAFGVWALVSVLVLAVVLAGELRGGGIAPARAAGMVGFATLAGLLAALPTIADLSGSLRVAKAIASTSNPGNLRSPLRAEQVLGIWVGPSYKLEPSGTGLLVTEVLLAIALLAVIGGAIYLLLRRRFALAAWIGLTLLAWLIVSSSVTTWASAKTLMLTAPAVMLLAWAGVAALRSGRARAPALAAAAALALALTGGVLASDALQYRSSNLAPTGRYQELASIDGRFAGRGPALFTDFDEYSLYVLRDLDIGGPDFTYPPPSLAATAGGYGSPVDLDLADPAALAAYPLIITRRDPLLPRPPAAYRLAFSGDYYEVWERIAGAPPALAHVPLTGVGTAAQCLRIRSLARAGLGTRLTAAPAPEIVHVALAEASHPAGWGHERASLVMRRAGTLSVRVTVPSSGRWELWVQGQIMPTVGIGVDGRRVGAIGGLLSGNSLVPDTAPPISLDLAAGEHTLTVTRPALGLAPGDDGAAVLAGMFLTPAHSSPAGALVSAPAARYRALCGRRYQWVEVGV